MVEKVREYVERFDKNFPLFIVRNLGEEEIIRIIDECIKKNEPYHFDDTRPDVYY